MAGTRSTRKKAFSIIVNPLEDAVQEPIPSATDDVDPAPEPLPLLSPATEDLASSSASSTEAVPGSAEDQDDDSVGQPDDGEEDEEEGETLGDEEDEDDEEDSPLVCSLYELLCAECGTNVTEAILGLKESLDTQNKILYSLVKQYARRQ